MGLRLKPSKVLACCLLCGCCVCLISVFLLSGTSRSRHGEHRRQRPVGNISLEFRYNYLLQYMGYAQLRVRSKVDKAKVQHFFASVRHFAISSAERRVFIELLELFQVFCQQNRISFFLYFGSLLGAFRHHGFIPWDDDVDVFMPLSSKPKLQVMLSEHPLLAGAEKETFVVIVFLRDPKKSLPSYGRSWGWPYIEVHFYEFNRGQLLHRFDACGASKASDVFPLIEVPFENLTLPAPRRMDCLVRQCYKKSDTRCCTNSFDHRRDMGTSNGGHCIPCKLLEPIFPFVSSRRRHGDYVDEQLCLNGSEVRSRRVKKPFCILRSQW